MAQIFPDDIEDYEEATEGEKKVGLIVIEVKDWRSRQITSCNPHQFTLRVSEKTEKKSNPDKIGQEIRFAYFPEICYFLGQENG
jgi:hypothetical protein